MTEQTLVRLGMGYKIRFDVLAKNAADRRGQRALCDGYPDPGVQGTGIERDIVLCTTRGDEIGREIAFVQAAFDARGMTVKAVCAFN
jgi:hypothetical protein